MIGTGVCVVIGMTISNFVFQWFEAVPNYVAAAERSWFQATAVVAFLIIHRVSRSWR